MKAEQNTQERRRTGIEVLGDVPWGTHICQFYKSKKDLIDILVPYFKAGLEDHECCSWVVPAPLEQRRVRDILAREVSDLDERIKNGQMEFLLPGEWYLRDGAFDSGRILDGWKSKLDKALDRGYAGLRISGNPGWGTKQIWDSIVDYEKQVNDTVNQYRLIAICTYCLSDYGPVEIIEINNNHQFALIRQDGQWELIKDGERKRAEKKLLEYQAQLKSMASKLSLSEEKEKHRIAVTVLEQVAQTLALSKGKLETLSKSEPSLGTSEGINEVGRLLGETIWELRSLTHEISSPVLYEFGFEQAVQGLLEEWFEKKYEIKCVFKDDGQTKPLGDDIKVLLFRSVRELLENVARHAKAKTVRVSVKKLRGQIKLEIEDDGVGFVASEVAQGGASKLGFGHFCIRERLEELGGHLKISSEPGKGCKVTMLAPLLKGK